MRILNVSDERLAELARRKLTLSRQIEAQRMRLEVELRSLRRPLRAMDSARAVGARLREHAPAVAMVIGPVLLLLARPLFRGVGSAVRLARKAARWWTLWKIGSQMLARMPGFFKGRGIRHAAR